MALAIRWVLGVVSCDVHGFASREPGRVVGKTQNISPERRMDPRVWSPNVRLPLHLT